jgi:hypothetical protein
MLAVTDFGLCCSPLLQSKNHEPEIAANLRETSYRKGNFGKTLSAKHILYYKALPPFSRDIYTLLKWIVHPPARSRTRAPSKIVQWCSNALDNVDKNEKHFDSPLGVAKIFDFMFGEGELALFGFDPAVLRKAPSSSSVAAAASVERKERRTAAAKVDDSVTLTGAEDSILPNNNATTCKKKRTRSRSPSPNRKKRGDARDPVFTLSHHTREDLVKQATNLLQKITY